MSVKKLVLVVCDMCSRVSDVDFNVDINHDTAAKARARASKAGFARDARNGRIVDLCPDCVRQPPARNATVGHVTPTPSTSTRA